MVREINSPRDLGKALYESHFVAYNFSTKGCAECEKALSELEKYEEELLHFLCITIDIDEAGFLVRENNVTTTPTTIFLEDRCGSPYEFDRVEGADADRLAEAVAYCD